MGYSAATGTVGMPALVLALILFVWQIPHFLGLAWLYREDYGRGGFRMLPVVEPEGSSTALMSVVYSIALIPSALLMLLFGSGGQIYTAGCIVLGGFMVYFALHFMRERSNSAARTMFVASLAYLPLLMLLLILDPAMPGNPAGMERILVHRPADAGDERR
jgi:heme O synthase-like polyprenyltransferase